MLKTFQILKQIFVLYNIREQFSSRITFQNYFKKQLPNKGLKCLNAQSGFCQILIVCHLETYDFIFGIYPVSKPLGLSLYMLDLNRFLDLMLTLKKPQFAFPFRNLSENTSCFFRIIERDLHHLISRDRIHWSI